jgi:hypothetical protein
LHTFSPPLKGRAVSHPQTWPAGFSRTLTSARLWPAMICMPRIYLRASTISLCLRGCVTDDLGENHTRSTAPLYYEQTPTCRRIQRQSPDTYRTKDVRLCRTWQRSNYNSSPSDVIYYFPQLKYKAPLRIPPQILSLYIFCADRDDERHGRRRSDSRRSRLLRRGLLLRDRRAHPQRRHRLARRHLHAHLRDQLLHAPDKNARPVHRPPPLHDTVHRAGV